MECSSEELDYTKNGITSKACCCINICSIKLGVTPAKHRMQIQLLYSFIHLWKKNYCCSNLWYVFPLENFTSGQAHASENETSWVALGAILREAAIAAPIDDPGLEHIGVFIGSRWSKDPCCHDGKEVCQLFVHTTTIFSGDQIGSSHRILEIKLKQYWHARLDLS